MVTETIEEPKARVAQERREHYPARKEAVEDLFEALRARAKREGFEETGGGIQRLHLGARGVGTAALSRFTDALAFFVVVEGGVSASVPLVELDDLPVRFDPREGRFVALDGESDVVGLLMERLRYVCGLQVS